MPADVLEAPPPRRAGGPRRARADKPRRRLRTIGSYTLLTAGAIVVLFPIYVTIVNSLLAAGPAGAPAAAALPDQPAVARLQRGLERRARCRSTWRPRPS